MKSSLTALAVCGLAFQKQSQYLRGPQQRSLVQRRLPVRPGGHPWRWQPDGTAAPKSDTFDCTRVLVRLADAI
jgi:hypothetical protein